MPISPSKRGTKPPAPVPHSRLVRPFILIVVLAVLLVIVAALPASMIKHFLPLAIEAEDFSGTLWHGSAGKIGANARNFGAIEWHLHPASLLTMTLSADLHWVKVGFVADASAEVDRRGMTVRDVQGGGPLEDLSEFGIGQGWRGTSNFKFKLLKLTFGTTAAGTTTAGSGTAGSGASTLTAAIGDLDVLDLASQQVANGADLGGYSLHIANGAITPDTDATAEITDTGGPLEVQATVRFSAAGRTGILSGTVKERPDAPPALRGQLDNLTQLHARDAQGRIPVELEFTL